MSNQWIKVMQFSYADIHGMRLPLNRIALSSVTDGEIVQICKRRAEKKRASH